METFHLRTHWDQLSFVGESTKEQSFRFPNTTSPGIPLDTRYGIECPDPSSFLDSQVVSQCSPELDALSKQMSTKSPDVFNFDTSPTAISLNQSPSSDNYADMTVVETRVAPRSRRHRGVTTPDVINKDKRKEQEQHRRDRLSGKVHQIARLLPPDCSSKKPTKAAILRTAASQLRLRFHFPKEGDRQLKCISNQIRTNRRWRPESVDNASITHIFEVSGGFILVIDMSKTILYATPNIEHFLGHQNVDIMGNHLFEFLHEGDWAIFEKQIREAANYPERMFRTPSGEAVSKPFSVICKFLEKPAARSEILSYKVMRCKAILRSPAMLDDTFNPALMKLTIFAQVMDFAPSRKFGVTDAIQNEYVTQHKLDGTIVFADHRISSLTGYLPNEVLWKSAHKYMFEDDRPVAEFALARMLTKKRGSVVYRLRTESGACIYLRSYGLVAYDTAKMEPEMFVCVNTLLSDEFGEQERLEFVRRYTNQIATQPNKNNAGSRGNASRSLEGLDALEDDDDYVFGGRSLNPMAIENLVDDDMKVGTNSLIKVKAKGYNADEFFYGMEGFDEPPAGGMCSPPDFRPLPAVTYNMSPSERESSSPEFRDVCTPTTTASSPLNGEIGSPSSFNGNYPANNHNSVNGRTEMYSMDNHWLHPNNEGYNTKHRVSSPTPPPPSVYAVGNYALTPNSLSPVSGDNVQQTQRHDSPS